MPGPIDFYDYWNVHRGKRTALLDREKIALSLLAPLARRRETATFLDVGCGNGAFLSLFQECAPDAQLRGLDYSEREVAEARSRGLDVTQANLEDGLPLPRNSYDFVYAGEVIEHLYNPDLFLSEVHRVLKPGGHVLLSTPNLCAWFNRILVPFGVQPVFVETSTKSRLVGAGPLKGIKNRDPMRRAGSNPVGHLRIFTRAALEDLFALSDLSVVKVEGAIFDTGLPRSLWPVDRLFTLRPSLSSVLVVLGRKKQGCEIAACTPGALRSTAHRDTS